MHHALAVVDNLEAQVSPTWLHHCPKMAPRWPWTVLDGLKMDQEDIRMVEDVEDHLKEAIERLALLQV